jgi:hypothetical protein
LQWTISPESVKVQDLLFLGRYYIGIEVLSIVENRLLKGELFECGSRNAEVGKKGRRNSEFGMRKAEKREGGSGRSECGSGKYSIADFGLRIAELFECGKKGRWKWEFGSRNGEFGPVVVLKGWDYAAASMRKWEL